LDTVSAQVYQPLQLVFTFEEGSTISTQSFVLPPGTVNPLTFTIATDAPATQLCVQPNFTPYPGALNFTCPPASFASLNGSNTTTFASSVLQTRKSLSAFEATNKLLSTAQEVASNTTAYLYVTPGEIYYATIEANTTSSITIDLTYIVCTPGEFGENCDIHPTPLTGSGVNTTISGGSWAYFSLPVNSTTGAITVALTSSSTAGLSLYAQLGAIPTSNFYAQVFNSNSNNQLQFSIIEPFNTNSTWYVGVFNNNNINTTNATVSLTTSAVYCNSTTFGSSCSDISSISTVTWSADGSKFKKVSNAQLSNNWGLVFLTYDPSSVPTEAEYFRFSVGPQSGVNSLQTYARLGRLPTPAQYDFNGTMEYVSQVILANPNSTDLQWYVSVVATSDFYAWAGYNCLSCHDGGTCICDGQTCNNVTQYVFPTTTNDSFGMCQCPSKAYQKSFDCTQNPDAFSPVYIVLIVIGGLIVISVAIGVPLYCYMKSRKRSNYDTI